MKVNNSSHGSEMQDDIGKNSKHHSLNEEFRSFLEKKGNLSKEVGKSLSGRFPFELDVHFMDKKRTDKYISGIRTKGNQNTVKYAVNGRYNNVGLMLREWPGVSFPYAKKGADLVVTASSGTLPQALDQLEGPLQNALDLLKNRVNNGRFPENIHIYPNPESPPSESMEMLNGLSTSLIWDAMSQMEKTRHLVPTDQKVRYPVIRGKGPVFGCAVTVLVPSGNNFLAHTAGVSAPKDSIIIIQSSKCDNKSNHDGAVIGGIVSKYLKHRDVRGVICDNALIRDVDDFNIDGPNEKNFMVMATGVNGVGPHKHVNVPGGINIPLDLKDFGLKISPGDIVMMDADGFVSFPKEHLNAIVEKANQIDNIEKSIVGSKEGLSDFIGKTIRKNTAALVREGIPAGMADPSNQSRKDKNFLPAPVSYENLRPRIRAEHKHGPRGVGA